MYCTSSGTRYISCMGRLQMPGRKAGTGAQVLDRQNRGRCDSISGGDESCNIICTCSDHRHQEAEREIASFEEAVGIVEGLNYS
jgi:hypothetical protein